MTNEPTAWRGAVAAVACGLVGVLGSVLVSAQDNTRYTDSAFQISVVMPDGWAVQQLPGFVSATSPADIVTGAGDGAVSVMVQEVTGPRVRLDGYAELYRSSVYELYDGVQGWSMRDTTVAGTPAHVVDYDYPHEQITKHTRIIFLVRDRRAYLLSASALPERWESVERAYDTMVGSVTFPWTPTKEGRTGRR